MQVLLQWDLRPGGYDNKMFWGLRSLWIIPLDWRTLMAPAICCRKTRIVSSLSVPLASEQQYNKSKNHYCNFKKLLWEFIVCSNISRLENCCGDTYSGGTRPGRRRYSTERKRDGIRKKVTTFQTHRWCFQIYVRFRTGGRTPVHSPEPSVFQLMSVERHLPLCRGC